MRIYFNNLFGFDFKLIDTAGIRKKSKVHEDIEFYSVIRSVRSIEYSDVCIFMIDATDGLQKQDLNIFYMIEKNKKGVIVLVNKWDLIENKDQHYTKEYEDKLREEIEVQTVEPKEEDFSEDPIWQELKSKSTKAYKNLKNYEFDKRQQRHD